MKMRSYVQQLLMMVPWVLGVPTLVNAQPTPPAPTVVYNECDRSITCTFPVWYQVNNGDDNELNALTIKYNDGGSPVTIYSSIFTENPDWFPVNKPWNDADDFEPWDNDQYFTIGGSAMWTRTLTGGTPPYTGLTATNPDNTGWNTLTVNFKTIPLSWYGNTVTLVFAGNYLNTSEVLSASVPVSIPEVPAPSGLVVNPGTNCTSVNLTWNTPDFNCQPSQYRYQVRRRTLPDGAFNAWANLTGDGSTSSATISGLLQGTNYEFEIRTTFFTPGSSQIVASYIVSANGNTSGIPATPPPGFTATSNGCNQNVTLNWTSLPNISGYDLFRDGVLLTSLTAQATSYVDQVPASNVVYAYTIQAKNQCGSGPLSAPVNGGALGGPVKPGTPTLTVLPGSGVQIDWEDVSNESRYEVVRTQLGGGGQSVFNVNQNITTYLDQTLTTCVTYLYNIRSFNSCNNDVGVENDTAVMVTLEPDLAGAFNPNTSLRASKGFFPNRVRLEWSLNVPTSFIDEYKIYRRQLGTSGDSLLQQSLLPNNSSWNDDFTEAGVLYEYFIVAERLCADTIIASPVAHSVGFRSPTATVTGNVSYGSGIAVEGVRVQAESANGLAGNSLLFNGTNFLTVADAPSLDVAGELLLETWVRPTSYDAMFVLFQKDASYELTYEKTSDTYRFQLGNAAAPGMPSINFPASMVPLNNYSHIAVQLTPDSLECYVNGERVAGQALTTPVDVSDNGNPLKMGDFFNGYLDEVRIWNISKTPQAIRNDHSRLMTGGETGLRLYLRFDEGLGANAYDLSKTGNLYNENHAGFFNAPQWSTIIPTSSQLGAAAYTNALGNYVLNAPYKGNGEVFVLTPSYLIHEFNPSTRALFLGDGSSVQVGVDFIDKSSFSVSGSVVYENTTCGVPDALIKIDGQQVIVNGVPAKTDAQGLFSIQVPIGEHVITVEQSGHTYAIGRFPATGAFDFQNVVNGIAFVDNTLVKVVGRVVGGRREGDKIAGLGKSKNNIGRAEIVLTSQQGNGCSVYKDTTDALTGEYTLMVPPLRYVPQVKILNNPTIDFGVLNLVDLSSNTIPQTETDTIFGTNGSIAGIESITYNRRLDYIYRVQPQIAVFDRNGVDPFIGDTVYTYVNPQGVQVSRNLRTHPFRWPIFTQGDDNDYYRCQIRVFEEYINLDNNKRDSVPTTDGRLEFNNTMADVPFAAIDMDAINNEDSVRTLVYTFQTGFPNFNKNASIPQYSFTHTLEINLITPQGQAIPWLPIPADQMIPGGDRIFRGYLLGKRSNGQQFVTFGPQVPEYVLRDPPGSESFAKRETGSSKVETSSWGWTLGGSAHTSDQVYAGSKFTLGIGVSTETDIKSNINIGFEAELSGGRNGSQSFTTTNTKAWQTYDNTVIAPGAASDLYIGKSQNLQFGVAEELTIFPENLPEDVEAVSDALPPANGFFFGKKYGISIVPGGYETQFLFNEYDIKNQVLPNLRNLRKLLLLSGGKYVNKLSPDDPNFGLNNDDPAFGVSASSATPFTGDFADLDGPSYRYNAANLADSLSGDSVRIINHQILKWEEAIRLNEWEKVNITNVNVLDSLEEVELQALSDEYDDVLIAYAVLVDANLVGAGVVIFGLASAPGPGTAASGYATFALFSGANIAITELVEEYETYVAKKDRIEAKFDELRALATAPLNYTFTGGTSFESAVTHESAITRNNAIEFNMNAEFKLEIAGKVNNNGVGIEKGIQLNYSSSREWGDETNDTETVGFKLGANIGDQLSVDVYPSMLGWGPIFKTRPGSATSCPHEQATVTEYYEPGTEINPVTRQIEKPTLSSSQTLLTNIPADEPAVFNLTLGNESEVGYAQKYDLRVISASNPFGAIIRFDGFQAQAVEIPGFTSLNKVMTIEKGPGSVYQYDSILVVFASQCQYTAGTGFNTDIADSVYVSAHFLPTCTNVTLATPENQWVLNNSFNDTMPVAVVDYNINTADLEFLRVDYKPSDQPNWIGLQTFLKDTSGMPGAEPIPTGLPFTLYDWDVSQLPDGEYDLRVVSQCLFAEKASVTHSGIIDRINPHPFGTPSPADGILSPNDDILIRFNEPIYAGSINPIINFDIRGVTNGTTTSNSTSLFFDGVNDVAEVTGGVPLQQRDFTIEFAAKRNGTGEQCVFSQGTDPNERIYIGFDANNRFVFRINDQQVVSTGSYTDNNWRYYAVSYDYEGETAQLFVADGNTTATVVNTGNTTLFPDYVGNGPVFFGKNSANNGNFFRGNLSEVRVWNRTRTLSEFSVTKTMLLSGSELGLLYNWRLDEGSGANAEEHLRRRDASLSGPTWQITPGGNSASFDGVNDHLKVTSGDVAITDGMDMTLEFWFNSSQTGEATLFSNGTGTGLNADSLVSWNITKDANGLIHVKHYGIDFVATDENFFDGSWHHFALVLQRSGNLSAYVDGNLQNAIQAQTLRQLGGASVYLGARGYTIAQAETTESFFNGNLDEFRIWNAARKLEQVRRDMNFRMRGDELGLLLYMPFENYTTDPTGVPILTPSFNEQISTAQHPVAVNGPTLSNLTPAVKIQRPVQAIAFTYSVNNDAIVLTPTTSQEIIENVTLDITVEGLKDLHGNVMESPVTWIAYVDKNQVVWQDDLLAFEMMRGEELTFTTNIVNQGGSLKAFDILDIPSWLTVSPSSGNIAPNSSLEVTFTVDPDIALGDYVVDLSLLTDFNFPERLTIDLKVRAQAPNWVVNTGAYEQTMGVIGRLRINNVVSTDDEDILACFVGTELRGVAKLEYVPQLDVYLAFMDVYGVLNDKLEFRIWDASSGLIYTDVTPNNLLFTPDAIVGSTSNPQVFTTSNLVSIEVPINTGWNWLGFPMQQLTPNNLVSILASFPHANGDLIKYLDQAATFTGPNWTPPNSMSIQPERLYKLRSSFSGTLVMEGTRINPTTRPITLQNGWNWIGFISLRNQPVEQALGNLTPVTGDIIKGKTQFAMYDQALGWIGSLKTMKPGQGFMYRSIGTKTFTYPLAGMFPNLQDEPASADDRGPVNASVYSANMTVVGTLAGACDNLIDPSRYTVALYDSRGDARGYAGVETVDDEKRTFLTIAGDPAETLQVRLIDNQGGPDVALDVPFAFEPNGHVGTFDQPYVFVVSDAVCRQLAGDGPETEQRFAVYPSNFTSYLMLEYTAEAADPGARVQLTNQAGQVVFITELPLTEGANERRIELAGRPLPSGVYTLELFANGKVERVKVVKAVP